MITFKFKNHLQNLCCDLVEINAVHFLRAVARAVLFFVKMARASNSASASNMTKCIRAACLTYIRLDLVIAVAIII